MRFRYPCKLLVAYLFFSILQSKWHREVIAQEMIFQLSGDNTRITWWYCECFLLVLTEHHFFYFIRIKLAIVVIAVCIKYLHVLFKVLQSLNFSSLVLIIRLEKKRLSEACPLTLLKNLIWMSHHMSMIVKSPFWRYLKWWAHVLLISLDFFFVDDLKWLEYWMQLVNDLLIDRRFFLLSVVVLSLLLPFPLSLNHKINILLRQVNFFELIDRVGKSLL